MLKNTLLVLSLCAGCCLTCSPYIEPVEVSPFLQEFQSNLLIDSPAESCNNINAVCMDEAGNVWAATACGIWVYRDSCWKEEPFFAGKAVKGIHFDEHNVPWVLWGDEIFAKKNGSWHKQEAKPLDVLEHIEKSFIGENNTLWVGTPEGIFISTPEARTKQLGNYLVFLPNQAIHTTATGDVWIGFRGGAVCFDMQGIRTLYTGENGLPYEDIRCIASTNDAIWFGTSRGAIKFTLDGAWKYYASKRWLPHDQVNDMAISADGTIWIATSQGISKIEARNMTLFEKTRIYEDIIEKRHNRHGLVSGSRLLSPGDLSTNMLVDNDNDGLWTSIYLAAECFRYAVTRSDEAKQKAIRSYEAMERLERINGRSGFVSRSFIEVEKFRETGGEWHLSADKKWMWKGDTSSDEIVGHYFAYTLFYDLVAEDDYKNRVSALVERITDHILDNNYCMIDLDGLPTRWAVWCPDSLNTPSWFIEHGLNSLQILAFLRAAYHVTGKERYLNEYRNLIENYGYAQNMVNQKIMFPGEINHSDDELAFLPYYTLFSYADEQEYVPIFRQSMERSWKYEAPEKCPLWNFIASFALQRSLGLEDAVESLERYPVDLITWTIQNSQRADMRIDPRADRFNNPQNLTVLPPDERPAMKWNGNPYQLDGGGGGYGEDDGAAFLLPYWMGRYHKFIVESE
ncbi:transcriptional regulator [candidate division KSB1 bacterium]|nr:transcriptional regulator [candidate division KSB1 bacterium]